MKYVRFDPINVYRIMALAIGVVKGFCYIEGTGLGVLKLDK